MDRVRGKSIKHACMLSLIFLFILSLPITNVTSNGSTVLYVDPPEVRDDTLQAGSNFSVDICISDVTDLYAWQVHMSWDPSIINATTITEGTFLKGPYPWDSHPYDHATKPYSAQTKTPGTSVVTVAGWDPSPVINTLVDVVATVDNKEARSTTDNSEVRWEDFGFVTGGMSSVATLEIAVRTSTTETNTTEQDKVEIEVSNDGGTSWGPTHIVDAFTSEITFWVDVTEDFSWTPSMLTDANFKVMMRYMQVESTAARIAVDYLAARAVDTIIVENPDTAYDKSLASYASFSYSDTTGNFTVHDFSHDFPSGCDYPFQETSTITQVDFKMTYSATASASGDQYKIAYYVGSSAETVLQGWKSTATSLGNYTWAAQTEPNDGTWTWTDVSNIEIVVETNRVGGDATAVFKEYEAWVTVHYIRPTGLSKRVEEGWAEFSVSTSGQYPGVDGSGMLGTIEFEVLAYGDTILNITHQPDTMLQDSSLPPQSISFTPENGYFNNMIPGDIQGDTGGTPPDGDVDRYDFFAFAGCYGSVLGDSNYNPLADLQGDTTGTPPDGDVDRYDFFAFAGHYGESIGP